MTRPLHWINIYQKFRRGGKFLAHFPISSYKHKIAAIGGYDTASCNLIIRRYEAERFFSDYIGCTVAVYAANAIDPIWEGLISRITYSVGGNRFSRSLDNMSNRIDVTYYSIDSVSAQKTEQTGYADNVTSQETYGVKLANFDAGVHYNATDTSHKISLRNMLSAQMSFPEISTELATGDADGVSIEMQGFYHVWDWETYKSTNTATNELGALIERIAIRTDSDAPENAPYIYATGTGIGSSAARKITANAASELSRESKTGQTYWQFLQSIVEAGDGVNPWVIGITALNAFSRERVVYYRPANTAVRYTIRGLSEPGIVRTIYGAKVQPWEVRPDCKIKAVDVLNYYNSLGNDPRETYVSSVEYDADGGTVSFQGNDDPTLEGAFGLRRYFKKHGSRFNAPTRLTG